MAVSGRTNVVLGGGLSGLSAAVHLPDATLYEAETALGGHCRTHHVDGFGFDEGAHVFFGKDEDARKWVLEPLAGELVEHSAEIWNCYGAGHFGRYPVQLNAHALAPEEATRCVLGFCEAARDAAREMPDRYDAWCRAAFGDAFAERFFLRYARKIWTVDPAELTTEWLGSSVGARVTRPSLEAVLRGAIDPAPQAQNYVQRFSYPRTGGFGRIAEPLRARLDPARLRLGARLASLDAGRRELRFSDGTAARYDATISTIPLPVLVAAASDAPAAVRAAAARLRWTRTRCVNLGIDRADVGPGHWCYFYEPDVPFFRTSVPSRFSADNAPAGTSALTCELAHAPWRPLDEDRLVERVIDALRRVGVLHPGDRVLHASQVECPFGYAIFDAARAEALAEIHAWMRAHGLEPAGRFGEWGYHWSFEAIGSGRRAAERVRGAT